MYMLDRLQKCLSSLTASRASYLTRLRPEAWTTGRVARGSGSGSGSFSRRPMFKITATLGEHSEEFCWERRFFVDNHQLHPPPT